MNEKLTPETLRKISIMGMTLALLDHALAWEADLTELARLWELVKKQRAVVDAQLVEFPWSDTGGYAKECRICGWVDKAGPQHSPECPMAALDQPAEKEQP